MIPLKRAARGGVKPVRRDGVGMVRPLACRIGVVGCLEGVDGFMGLSA